MQKPETFNVRPYQLLCVICLSGNRQKSYPNEAILSEIRTKCRTDPNRPLTLRCNVEGIYSFQNPGRDDDTPEGKLFNDKRDLDILQKLGLVPGSTRPARDLFKRIFQRITTCQNICGYEAGEGVWQGCPLATSGNYERGIAMGVDAVVPARSAEDLAATKRESVQQLYEADRLLIRPHHLMCMTCFHGGRATLEPIDGDNLFEPIDIMQKNPEIPVTLKEGCCMVCPPCRSYDPHADLCVGGNSMSLRDQKKDLDVLQRLGLTYGDTLPARELYRRLFEAFPTSKDICGFVEGIETSPEWKPCGSGDGDSEGYRKGRAAGLGIPGLKVI